MGRTIDQSHRSHTVRLAFNVKRKRARAGEEYGCSLKILPRSGNFTASRTYSRWIFYPEGDQPQTAEQLKDAQETQSECRDAFLLLNDDIWYWNHTIEKI